MVQQYLKEPLQNSRSYGWRIVVLIGCFTSCLVLCCNIAILAAGATRHGGYSKEGVSNLMYGASATISWWNTAFHIRINVFSSMLLARSNYTMQVISSRTRQEIDKAHLKERLACNWAVEPKELEANCEELSSGLPHIGIVFCASAPVVSNICLEGFQC